MDVAGFLNKVNSKVQGAVMGDPYKANDTPSGLDIANSQIAPGPARGVWGVLSQFARMRGQERLGQLFAAKEEQDRQLKNSNIQSEIDSRGANRDFIKAQIDNLGQDNKRADFAAKTLSAKDRVAALEQSNGSEPNGVKLNYVEQLPMKGLPAPQNPSGPPSEMKLQNPEVEFPGYDGAAPFKVRPQTANQKTDQAMLAKIHEEMFKTNIIPKDARAVNQGTGMDISNTDHAPDTADERDQAIVANYLANPKDPKAAAAYNALKEYKGLTRDFYFPLFNQNNGNLEKFFSPKTNTTVNNPSPGTVTSRPSESERTSLTSFDTLEQIFKNISDLSDQVHQYEGPEARIRGAARRVMAKLGKDNVITQLQSQKGLMGNFARSLGSERGVLTDPDIERAASLVPIDPNLTKGEAMMKRNEIRQLIDTAKQAKIRSMGGAQ